MRFGRRIRASTITPLSLFSECLPILELDHDEFRGLRDIVGQMDICIAAAQRSGWDRGRLRRSIGQREVERLVREKDGTTRRVSMHDGSLSRAILHSEKPHQLVFK